jgi:dTDP-4-dehydrorhamnose reductase
MKRQLIILGSGGMLGQMVKKYFTVEGFDITCFDRRFGIGERAGYSDFLRSLREGYVINCIYDITFRTTKCIAKRYCFNSARDRLHIQW